MQLIEAYNVCLRAIGQAAIASLDSYDPDVAEISNHVNEAKRQILSNGYPYNTDTITLSPDPSDGNKLNISGYLAVRLPDNLAERGGYVWEPSKAAFYTDALAGIRVVQDLSWTDIPVPHREWIAYRAALSFLLQVKGPVPEIAYYERKEREMSARAEAMYPTDFGVANGTTALLGRFYR